MANVANSSGTGGGALSGVKSAVSSTSGSIWANLPLWAKGLIIVGGGYVAYKIGGRLLSQTRLDPKTRDSSQALDGWNKQFLKDSANAKPTKSEGELKDMANTIFRAMDGWGTDEDAILSTFKKIKNNADFSGLQAAWGKRTIDSGKWNPAPNLYNATLAEAVTDEMSDYWRNEVNKHLGKVGVTHRL